jgi:hypothetical protein
MFVSQHTLEHRTVTILIKVYPWTQNCNCFGYNIPLNTEQVTVWQTSSTGFICKMCLYIYINILIITMSDNLKITVSCLTSLVYSIFLWYTTSQFQQTFHEGLWNIRDVSQKMVVILQMLHHFLIYLSPFATFAICSGRVWNTWWDSHICCNCHTQNCECAFIVQ